MIESRRDNGFCFLLNHRRKLALIPALMILSGVSWTGMCCGDKRYIKDRLKKHLVILLPMGSYHVHVLSRNENS